MIIFINGTVNTGKTTLAKALAKNMPKMAHIEVDDLRHFITDIPLEEAIPINLENLISVANNFAKHGIDSVVSYPLSQKNFEFVKNNLVDKKIFVFTLDPGLLNTLKDRGERKLDDWERARIKHHYESGVLNLNESKKIDTSNLSVEETVKLILKEIGVK